MANGTRLLVHANERAPPQVTRSSRVKVTYLRCHKCISSGPERAEHIMYDQLTTSSDHSININYKLTPNHTNAKDFLHSYASHVITTYHRDIHVYMEPSMRMRDENERYIDS